MTTTNLSKKHTATYAAQKERLKWVDFAKCFSILLVVSFHSPCNPDGYIGEILRLLRMPAFFMISGFLFKIEKFPNLKQFIKHRSIQLLVPYTSFFVIFYTLWLAGGRNWIGGEDMECPLWQPLFEFISGSPHLIVAPYWFICCLFSIQVIYYLLFKYLNRNLALTVIAICPILYSLHIFHGLPWNISNAILYLPIYAFANQCKNYIAKLTLKNIVPALIMLSAVLIGNAYISPDYNPIIRNILNTVFSILIIPAYVIFIKTISNIKLVKMEKAVQFIGKNSIIILALQNYFIGAAKLLFPEFIIKEIIFTNILMTFMNVAFCCIPIVLINKYIPFMIGRGKYFENILKQTKRTMT